MYHPFKRKFVQVEILKDVYGCTRWEYVYFSNLGKTKKRLKMLRNRFNTLENGCVRFYIKEVYKTNSPQGEEYYITLN